MTDIICIACKRSFNPLEEPGAIVIGAPMHPEGPGWSVVKYHMCPGCYADQYNDWLGRKPVCVPVQDVGWALLRQQKTQLLEEIQELENSHRTSAAESLTGILHLLDHIQDEAAKRLGEEAVFGVSAGD